MRALAALFVFAAIPAMAEEPKAMSVPHAMAVEGYINGQFYTQPPKIFASKEACEGAVVEKNKWLWSPEIGGHSFAIEARCAPYPVGTRIDDRSGNFILPDNAK